MALVLAFINEIVHSDKCATEFARMYTNAPFFIDEKDADGNGTGYQLRESYLKEDGNEELYAAWDENSDQLIFWSGDWQNAKGVGGPKAFQWLDAEGNIVADAKPRCPAATRSTARRTAPAGTSWWSTSPRGPSSAPPSSASFPRQDQGSHRRYIDASPHACFTRGQKVEFSINTSGISQAFTIMMRWPATSTRRAARTSAASPPPATTPSCSTSCRTRRAAWGSAARKRP